MHEFSSISVSAYEPAELTKQLNEQTAAGWSVVSIVPTGSTVTAYLSRAAGSGDASVATGSSDYSAVSADTSADTAADAASGSDSGVGDAVVAAGYTSEMVATDTGAVGTDDYTAVTDTGAVISDQVDWAAGDAAGAASQATADATSAVADTASQGTQVVSTEVGAAAASTASAPPGWYSDPAGRFELRYWDGGQWTEHVSTNQVQYTDPPVA